MCSERSLSVSALCFHLVTFPRNQRGSLPSLPAILTLITRSGDTSARRDDVKSECHGQRSFKPRSGTGMSETWTPGYLKLHCMNSILVLNSFSSVRRRLSYSLTIKSRWQVWYQGLFAGRIWAYVVNQKPNIIYKTCCSAYKRGFRPCVVQHYFPGLSASISHQPLPPHPEAPALPLRIAGTNR